MTGSGMALMQAARRALLAIPGGAAVRIVRDRRREELPLGSSRGHLLEPVAAERLAWPQSQDWRYELAVLRLATLGRGRGDASQEQHLAECHEAALDALRGSLEILEAVADGPPSREAALAGTIGGVRWGPTSLERSEAGDPLSFVTTVGLGFWTDEPAAGVTFDGAALFGSGPHELIAGSPERATAQRLFSGLAGGLTVDLGPGPRRLAQRGRLAAASAAELAALEAAIEARIDGRAHPLVDRGGQSRPYVRLDRFERRGPLEVGLSWHRAYEIEYTDLMPGG